MKKILALPVLILALFFAQAQKGYPEFDLSGNPYPPLVSFGGQLSGGLDLATNGRFQLTENVGFSPTKTKSGASLNLLNKPFYYHVKIYKDNAVLKDVDMCLADLSTGFFKRFYSACVTHDYDCFPQLTEGHYKLETYLGDLLINNFEFEVVKKSTTDPYSTQKDFYYLRGPWDQYASVNFDDKTGNLIFKSFLQIDSAAKYSVDVKCNAEILYNGQPFSNPGSQKKSMKLNNSLGHPAAFETAFKLASNKNNYVHLSDMKDGTYTFKITTDVTGTKTYELKVAGGKVVTPDYMDLDKKDYANVKFGSKGFYYIKGK